MTRAQSQPTQLTSTTLRLERVNSLEYHDRYSNQPFGGLDNSQTDHLVDLSVVIPILNEEASLNRLYDDLSETLQNLGKRYEIIFVDDGSTDNSFTVIQELLAHDPHVHIIRFRRNFGQTAAFSAGFDLATGVIIVTMDADLQNSPDDIPLLLSKIDEGFDIVSGWRVARQDPFLTRRLPSLIANRLISAITGVKLHDYGCSLKAYRSEVIKSINLYGQMHRFIPALASSIGVDVAEVPVNHLPRRFGQSKYNLSRTVKVILDLLTVKFLLSYSTRPIQIFGLFGALSLLVGTSLGLYLAIARMFLGQPLADRPILLFAVLLIVIGVQLISVGLLGELIIRTYYQASGHPTYRIRQVLGASMDRQPEQAQRTYRMQAGK